MVGKEMKGRKNVQNILVMDHLVHLFVINCMSFRKLERTYTPTYVMRYGVIG